MYKLLLAGTLVLAMTLGVGLSKAAAEAPAGSGAANEKKDGGPPGPIEGKVDVGGKMVDGVAVLSVPPVTLTPVERTLIGIGLVLLAIIIAQLAFLRSSIEKMTG